MGRGMADHRLINQSFPHHRPRHLSIVVPVWCGWGVLVLWLVVAQPIGPTIRFRVFSRRAAFFGVESIFLSLFSSFAGGLVNWSGLGLPVSHFHGLPMRLMLSFVICRRRPSL